jgi:hypothetical protein
MGAAEGDRLWDGFDCQNRSSAAPSRRHLPCLAICTVIGAGTREGDQSWEAALVAVYGMDGRVPVPNLLISPAARYEVAIRGMYVSHGWSPFKAAFRSAPAAGWQLRLRNGASTPAPQTVLTPRRLLMRAGILWGLAPQCAWTSRQGVSMLHVRSVLCPTPPTCSRLRTPRPSWASTNARSMPGGGGGGGGGGPAPRHPPPEEC